MFLKYPFPFSLNADRAPQLKAGVRHLPLTMNIEVQPLGNEYRFDGKESGIVEVFESLSGLRIIVSTWTDSINEALLQVYFRRPHAYRYLDELDLIAYWKTEKFRSPHHVYEITSGGWLNGEPSLPDMLDSARNTGVREWFISTTNGCMNVLAASPPEVAELKR